MSDITGRESSSGSPIRKRGACKRLHDIFEPALEDGIFKGPADVDGVHALNQMRGNRSDFRRRTNLVFHVFTPFL